LGTARQKKTVLERLTTFAAEGVYTVMRRKEASSLGDAESSLVDAKSSLGGAKSSLGDAESSLGGAKSSLGDAESSLGGAESSLGGAKSSLGDAESSLGDAKSSLGDAKSSLGDAKSSLGRGHEPMVVVSLMLGTFFIWYICRTLTRSQCDSFPAAGGALSFSGTASGVNPPTLWKARLNTA
jgi:hypothetical protein